MDYDKRVEFLKTLKFSKNELFANNGIPVIIPENDIHYVLVNIDPAYAYLIRQGKIVSEKTEFYRIDRKLFDEVFEKL